MTKRPWTPGPWAAADFMGLFMQAGNVKLACKAPEMAELLIELLEKHDFITEHIGPTDLSDIFPEVRKLLKEVGYANED